MNEDLQNLAKLGAAAAADEPGDSSADQPAAANVAPTVAKPEGKELREMTKAAIVDWLDQTYPELDAWRMKIATKDQLYGLFDLSVEAAVAELEAISKAHRDRNKKPGVPDKVETAVPAGQPRREYLSTNSGPAGGKARS